MLKELICTIVDEDSQIKKENSLSMFSYLFSLSFDLKARSEPSIARTLAKVDETTGFSQSILMTRVISDLENPNGKIHINFEPISKQAPFISWCIRNDQIVLCLNTFADCLDAPFGWSEISTDDVCKIINVCANAQAYIESYKDRLVSRNQKEEDLLRFRLPVLEK